MNTIQKLNVLDEFSECFVALDVYLNAGTYYNSTLIRYANTMFIIITINVNPVNEITKFFHYYNDNLQ